MQKYSAAGFFCGKKGYTFKGWYSDPKFKKKVTKIAAGSTGSRKLYARWVRK